MQRYLTAVLVALIPAACGDLKFDETSMPTAPPGSTASHGIVGASISGQQFLGNLVAAATVVDDRLEFSAYDANGRLLTIAFGAPGPGTFDAGGPYHPVVSLTETAGDATYRWVSSTATGSGSITLNFLTSYRALGYFVFALFPDSATAAAGITARRSVTGGTFDVNVSR